MSGQKAEEQRVEVWHRRRPVLHTLHRPELDVDAGRTARGALDVRLVALDLAREVERALADEDATAAETLDHFCAMLGGFCGSVALSFGARGGLFIGGGIVPRLGERFARSAFRTRFEAKGRFADYLRAIPTPLLTDTLAALDGTAQALEQLR